MVSYDEFFFSFEKFETSCVHELLLKNLVSQDNRNAMNVNVIQASTYLYAHCFISATPASDTVGNAASP
jgi:hypothetical protein